MNQPQEALPLVNLIERPRKLGSAKLVELLKWEPETFGAIRVGSKVNLFFHLFNLPEVVYC